MGSHIGVKVCVFVPLRLLWVLRKSTIRALILVWGAFKVVEPQNDRTMCYSTDFLLPRRSNPS